MIKVNLLATTPAAAATSKEWLPREQRSAVGGVVMLFGCLALVGGWWYYLNSQSSSIDTRITAAQGELVRLKEASKVVEMTTARKNELAERLSLIERLRTAKREPVTLLETVSRSIPEGLWLLEVKQSGSSVQIDGRATSITAVTDFTERLQSSGFFKRPVEILSTGTESIEETEVVKFSVKAEPVPSQPAPGTAGAPGVTTGTVAGVPPATPGA
jgi:type IV pilus assembly protein PilN